MRLHILSDLHIEFASFTPSAVEADVIILAGDIWLGDRGVAWASEVFPPEKVVYVLGNHEPYGADLEATIERCRETALRRSMHFLEDDVAEVGGARFIGASLWSDFRLAGGEVDRSLAMDLAAGSLNDFRLISTIDGRRRRRRLRPQDVATRHEASRLFIETELKKSFDGPKVVVTHFLPSPLSISERFGGDPLNAYFCSDLTLLIEETQPDLWFHGHTHDSFDYRIGRTRVVCNPRGYLPDEPNPSFRPDLVVAL